MAAANLRSTSLAALLAVLVDPSSAGAVTPPPTSCPSRFAWENAQLTDSAIGQNTALFGFGSDPAAAPPPPSHPRALTTLGGALIKTVPLAAPCSSNWPQYDPVACQYVRDHWSDPHFHVADPMSAMFPIYQGRTCMPTDEPAGAKCTLGGYASYSVAVTKVSQIQLALNFARNTNLRLAVRNMGHDFGDKSIGAGTLSVWTHNLKDIQFLPDYNSKGHRGPAFKLRSGVVTEKVYAAAERNNVTVIGGECRTVGIAGGYIAGGGHSPIAPLVGMGADQILSLEVVLPNRRLFTVDEDSYPDLYWALRGGGGTYGVVTSVTVKAYLFQFMPMWGGNMTKPQFTTPATPFLADLTALGIPITPIIEYSSLYQAFNGSFPPEVVGAADSHATSRLFLRENLPCGTQ
ncbi:hypothetical protein C8A05DRAFT_37535 [Staphylotrichum tortipilum]|uniref:FAD-binding PCMH-type domain-containing protein n=1 Tax=Staphylotrichum tortipilum TaxID=2831512 RepID=A0AAN6MDG2_9PEZI|nr:hypothetical protein C8A05DRAFT_37535 [Staphylotrichum longicolle]